MANVIHLVIHLHKHCKQPKEEQHLRRVLSYSSLWQVWTSGIAIWVCIDIQKIILIHKIKIIPIILTPLGHRV